jgi:hypothetical protein
LFDWNISRCLQDAVADFFGTFHSWIDGRNDTDEDPPSRPEALSDDFQHARAIRFSSAM